MGLYRWFSEYVKEESISKNRKIGCILFIIMSFVFFVVSMGMDTISGYSIIVGFPIALMTLYFGIGFRIGKEYSYLLYSISIVAIIAIVTYFHNKI